MSRLALRILLSVLGWLLARASRTRPEFRGALSQDRTIVIAGGDVAYHYSIRDRRLIAGTGTGPEPDYTLRFATPWQAVTTLLSPNGVGKIIRGALDGTVELEGDITLLLWFEGRIQQVVPTRGPTHRTVRFPGAYVMPREDNRASAWITRLPAKSELDADWTAAWEQRNKIWMVRVGAGEPHLEF